MNKNHERCANFLMRKQRNQYDNQNFSHCLSQPLTSLSSIIINRRKQKYDKKPYDNEEQQRKHETSSSIKYYCWVVDMDCVIQVFLCGNRCQTPQSLPFKKPVYPKLSIINNDNNSLMFKARFFDY